MLRSLMISKEPRWLPHPPWISLCATSVKSTGSIDGAKAVGKLLAERAKAAKVQAVVFDRGGRMYHGRVKALAEASREGGLQF